MNTRPARIQTEDDGELRITLDPWGEVAEVRRAGSGLAPHGTRVVRPGESLHGVPYEAWLARVDQSVALRELRHASSPDEFPDGAAVLWTRSGKSFWTTELGPKASMMFFLTLVLSGLPEYYREAFESGQGAVFFVIVCIALVGGALKLIFDVGFPRWLNLLLIAGLVGVVLTDFLSL